MVSADSGNVKRRKITKLDNRTKWILLIGVLASVGIMLFGLVIYTATGSTDTKAVQLGDILPGILRGSPVALISLGIIVLIATPFLRVVTVIFTMAEKRDTLFVIVGLTVATILLMSFLFAVFK